MAGFQSRSDWVNLPATTTPIMAADLLRYEGGIANLDCTCLPCDLATTANITLSGTGQTIDGSALTTSMRILVKNQTNGAQNGIYITSGSAWSRASDMATGVTIKSGLTVLVRGGSTQANTLWTVYEGLNNFSTALINSDVLAASQISGGGSSASPTRQSFTVRASSIGNGLAANGLATIDDVVLANNDLVYYEHTAAPTDNRILQVNSSGPWSTWSGMPNGSVWPSGLLIHVTEGTVMGGNTYITSNANGSATYTVGTSTIKTEKVILASNTGPTLIKRTDTSDVNIYGQGNYSYTLAGGIGIMIHDPSTDNNQVINLAIKQDSVGGHLVEFNPGTIIWENGWGPASPYSIIDTTPSSTTLIRLEWMGAAYGWRGHALTNVTPLTNPLPTSWTYQGSWNSTGAAGPTGAQALGFGSNAYSIRGYPSTNLTLAMDSIILLFSPAMRTRLQANNPAIEVCYRWTTEGPVGNLSRGNSDNAGGFNLSLGDHRNLVVFAAWRTDINMLFILGHELCHLISATYYGGNNANEPGFAGAPLISSHPTLASLQTDCLANGGNASGDEFFAEMELGRRLKAVGDTTDGATKQNGTAGPGTTGSSTTASRISTFNNYMTSLAGYQF